MRHLRWSAILDKYPVVWSVFISNMNLLQFLEMDVIETLLLSLTCFVVVFALSGIGSLFVKDNNRVCLQSAVGLFLIAALTMIATSYYAILAKYIIFAGIGISFVLVLYRLHTRTFRIRALLQSALPAAIIYTCFVALLMVYIFSHENTVDYNCHMIYCSAIPEEIFRADYFSRLRITDVYPYEWSKFHMFNGCMSAIPLAIFPLKNIVTFNLAKFVTIALLTGAIFEGLRYKYGIKRACQLTVILLFIFLVCANWFTAWTLFINNYSSFLIMGILWLAMLEKDYSNAALLSMALAIATSKSTITGLLFFFVSFYLLFRTYSKSFAKTLQAEWRAAIYCLILGVGCVVMAASGDHPANEQLFQPNFIENATSTDWMVLFLFYEPLNNFIQTKEILSLGWNILVPVFYLLIIVTHRKKIARFTRKHAKVLFYITILITSLYIMYWMDVNGGVFVISRQFFIIPLQCLFLYLLPIACLFSCCDKHMYLPLQLFVVFSFVQLMILNADNGACNYCLLMFPLALCIAENITTILDRIPIKLACALYIALFCGVLCYATCNNVQKIFVWEATDYHHYVLELSPINYLGDESYEYNDPQDAETVMRNSLKGNRIHYNVKPDQHDQVLGKLSMSMRFIPASSFSDTHL